MRERTITTEKKKEPGMNILVILITSKKKELHT